MDSCATCRPLRLLSAIYTHLNTSRLCQVEVYLPTDQLLIAPPFRHAGQLFNTLITAIMVMTHELCNETLEYVLRIHNSESELKFLFTQTCQLPRILQGNYIFGLFVLG